MRQAPHFRVRYSLGLAIALLVLGPLLIAVGVMTHQTMSIVLGSMNTAIGLGFAFTPYIIIDGSELSLRNMLGMTLRRAVVADAQGSPLGFSIQNDGRLLRWDDPDGKARPIKITRFSSRNEDFTALATWLRTSRLG